MSEQRLSGLQKIILKSLNESMEEDNRDICYDDVYEKSRKKSNRCIFAYGFRKFIRT